MNNYEKLYESMCAGCERENYCHENCEECEEFQDALEEMEAEIDEAIDDALKDIKEDKEASKALEKAIEKNKEKAKNSISYQKMMKFHQKNLKEILKQSGPWEWSWITDYIGEYLKWIRDYYELGVNVIGMEIKDTEEFNDPTHPTRLEIAQKLVDAWEEAFGENADFSRERVSAQIFFGLLGKNIGELWD